MNKIKFMAIFILMALVTFTSCSKDNETTETYDENAILTQLRFVDVNTRIANMQNAENQSRIKIIIVEWDEWGRKRRNCKGQGLCNADWFPKNNRQAKRNTSTNGSATLLEFDSSLNKYYIDILLAETPPVEIPTDALSLRIDEDFELNVEDEISQNLTFNQGDYVYDNSLGEFGGYRIYLY